ncbi:MAG: hypothetical protein ACRDGB_14525 [Candidatus Limnocylindria bacterium]
MSKQSGLGDRLFVGAVNLSGDVGSVQTIRDSGTLLETTGIDKSAFERIHGIADGEIAFNAFFNDEADAAHVTLSPIPSTNVQVTYLRGTTLGKPGASILAKQVDYPASRGTDGSLVFAVQALSANGDLLRWGQQLTAGIRTDSAATNGDGVDGAAASSFGLVAYLHVFAFTGTSATIAIQESSDDAAADAYAAVTGGAFASVTEPVAERIETAADLAVEQWLRVVTTGTFSDLQFAVLVARRYE